MAIRGPIQGQPALRDRGMFNAALRDWLNCCSPWQLLPQKPPLIIHSAAGRLSRRRLPKSLRHPGERHHLLPQLLHRRSVFLLPDLDTISLDPDFGRQEMIASGEVFDGGGVGFLGGIDMSTVMIYSSGALLGVVGANIGRDGKDDLSSGSSDPTSYVSDPASFVTDEFENQYGLGAINAQYAYARGHTGDGVLVSVMDTRFNTDHANLSGVFVEGYNVVSDDTVVDSGCTGPTNLPAWHPCRRYYCRQ